VIIPYSKVIIPVLQSDNSIFKSDNSGISK
jgi:hypothetical protein